MNLTSFTAMLFFAEFGISGENISLLSPVKMTLFVLFQGPPPTARVLSQKMNNDALFFIVPFPKKFIMLEKTDIINL